MKHLFRKYLIAQLALVACISVQAQTLSEAVRTVLQENPNVLTRVNSRMAADEGLKQAKGGYYPTVDLNAGWGNENSENSTTLANDGGDLTLKRGEAGILLRQMVFDGFRTQYDVERNKAIVSSETMLVKGAEESTALRATEVYLEYLRRSELVKLAKTNLTAHKDINWKIKKRSDRGIADKASHDQSKGRLALAQSNLISEKSNLREAEINFIRVIGLSPEKLVLPDAPRDALPQTLEVAIDQAKNQHPILLSAQMDVEATTAQHNISKAPYMPSLHLEVGANHNTNLDGVRGRNNDEFVMLRLRYNIFNGTRDSARKSETAHLSNEAREVRNRTCRQVVENMRLSWNAQKTFSPQLNYLKIHALSAEKARNAYKKQFNIGQRTLLDLLDQENEVFVARSNYVNAKYDELFSVYRILEAKGQLVDSLGLSTELETISSN